LGGQEVSVRLVSVFVVLVAVVVLVGGCGGDSTSGDPWLGSWRETDSPQHYVLTLSPHQEGGYTVTYPRSFKVPFYGELKGDQLEIYGENAWDVVWKLTYDEEADQLTAVGSQGIFHLQREGE